MEPAVAGDLYIPDGRRSGSRGPAVVMGHGFESFVKEALWWRTPDTYSAQATPFSRSIIGRSTAESEGVRQRGQLFPLNESEDYRNAINATSRPATRSTPRGSESGEPASAARW